MQHGALLPRRAAQGKGRRLRGRLARATIPAVDLLETEFPTVRTCQGRRFAPPRSG
jgi:hypothetical protein